MVLIGAYIAIGSGVVSVREHFELTDLQFFNAWPLKVLMLLLCINLITVTWNRIPLTPPRYGVWCIHAGIITLIVGTSFYYHFKVEGRTLIPINQTAFYFYDNTQRALWVRVMNRPIFGVQVQNGGDPADWLGLDKPVRFDVIGFYAYADVAQDVQEDPASNDSGVELKISNANGQAGSLILSSADPSAAKQVFGVTELEHRDVSPGSVQMIRDAAASMFHLSASAPGVSPVNLNAQLGATYNLGGGYSISLESFDPEFPLFGTHELVQALTLHVVSKSPAPQREFWRMILSGRPLQTDFKMDPATTPPMVKGNRQTEPIDKDLQIQFSF